MIRTAELWKKLEELNSWWFSLVSHLGHLYLTFGVLSDSGSLLLVTCLTQREVVWCCHEKRAADVPVQVVLNSLRPLGWEFKEMS